MKDEKQDLDDLPELPDMAELHEPELPELPDDALSLEATPAPEPPAARVEELPPLELEPISAEAADPLALDTPEPAADPFAIEEPAAADPFALEEAAQSEDPFASDEAEPASMPEPSPPEEPAPLAAAAAAVGTAAAVGASAKDSPGSTEPAAQSQAAPSLAPGEKPPLRVLDKAPLHLKKAAMIVVAGSLLPWMGSGGGWLSSVVAKLLVLAAAWFWFKQVEHNWGPQLKGFLGKLAEIDLRPKKKEKEGDKPKRRPKKEQAATALVHPFPTLLHVVSLVTVVVACVALPFKDASAKPGIAMAELGMLAWAAYTWVHIYAYERWGRFSPIFPLMFLGMLAGGAMRVVFVFGEEGGLTKIAGIAGGLLVAAGGGLAAYTIVEALMQAKKEGDLKKQAAMEARRAARKSRK